MNLDRMTWVIISFTTLSLIYTSCSQSDKDNSEKEKYKNYIAAKAVIDQRLPERVSRYGAKQARYNLTIMDGKKEKVVRFNCELSGDFKEKDTLIVYYDPADPNGTEVKVKIP
ncbi:hypothetical protein [Pedobacter caeni]|uniref:Uncharacterized protein n=1 Tax=Pedobacter caeni TaxID=288992 RepID=A0A1M5HG71_9SPHI|nr:hypothetical protein [Pedobacter caeni]SHG14888.1 hypothetical protein SAMN04488522_104648 [Pedobacter caeni]